MKDMIRYGLILGMICAIATGLLASVNNLTKSTIAAQADKELNDSLRTLFPDAENFEPVVSGDEIIYYTATRHDGSMEGIAFIAEGKGYSGTIRTLAAMRLDGVILAVKVLSQSETPGLGARISEIDDDTTVAGYLRGRRPDPDKRPWFQEQFSGINASELDAVQAITGATISSRCVIDSVKEKAEELLAVLNHG